MQNPIVTLRALKSFVTIVRNPNRVDQVFALAETFWPVDTLSRIARALAEDPRTAAALRARARLARIDLPRLGAMPEGTLGREFVDHLARNKLDPNTLPQLAADNDVMFVRAHLFETHDIWHVVTGFGTDVPGELGVQAFYLAQFPSRLASTILAAGLLHASMVAIDKKDALVEAVARGWAMGRSAKPLFGVNWDELWDLNLGTVRDTFGIVPASAPAAARSAVSVVEARSS